jgi:hypothetical protein
LNSYLTKYKNCLFLDKSFFLRPLSSIEIKELPRITPLSFHEYSFNHNYRIFPEEFYLGLFSYRNKRLIGFYKIIGSDENKVGEIHLCFFKPETFLIKLYIEASEFLIFLLKNYFKFKLLKTACSITNPKAERIIKYFNFSEIERNSNYIFFQKKI